MGFLSDLVARLKGKSSSLTNDQAPLIDPARVSRVLNETNSRQKTSDALLGKLFEANAAAHPVGVYVKPSVKDPRGPLSLHLNPAERMTIWLSKQRPEIVDAVAQQLNWDQAEEVILWVLKNKKTDAATAVKLFMKSEPAYYAIDGVRPPDGYIKQIMDAFSSNWIAGQYARGTVGYDPAKPTYSKDDLLKIYGTTEVKDKSGKAIDFSAISDLRSIEELNRAEREKRSSGKLPWPPLSGLEGPFAGPEPKQDISEYFMHDQEGYFTLRLLLGGLGTWIMDTDIKEDDYKKWLLANGFVDEAENI
jgi:Domain of unknown function (DUF4274)